MLRVSASSTVLTMNVLVLVWNLGWKVERGQHSTALQSSSGPFCREVVLEAVAKNTQRRAQLQ